MALIPAGRRRGALTTGAAMFLPVLVLLLLGGAESGWMSWRARQLAVAARRGAEVAASPMGTPALVEVAVTDALNRAGLGGVGFRTTVTPAELDAPPGSPVTVTVSVPYARVSLTGLQRLPLLAGRVSAEASLPKRARPYGLRAVAVAP